MEVNLKFWLIFLSLHQMTPLHVAAERGRFKIVKHFVSSGAEINAKDINGVKLMCLTAVVTLNWNAIIEVFSFMKCQILLTILIN